MPQSFGLRISPSTVLQNLLHQYPSGGQFLSEALQNAEDTDRATKFAAVLDLRKHGCERLRPPLEWRRRLQHEAILFYDNGGFTDRDWRSLQNIYASEKRHSPHEAGMYGMGSRSFFHMADVLQIVSRTKLAFLDPDSRVTPPQDYGECIDLVADSFGQETPSMDDAYPDECAPFKQLFGCDMRSSFPGTLIRAPLRAPEWAHESTFMKQPFGVDRAEKVFRDFEETLKNGEIVLFLSRVKCVELWRWECNGLEPTLLASTTLGVSSGHLVPRNPSEPAAVKAFLKQYESFGALQSALLSGEAPPMIHDLVDVITKVKSGGEMRATWLRRGSFFTEHTYLSMVETCSTVPLVAIALPVGEDSARLGRAFTYLPLPVSTGLPVHMHASFRLQDNRRGMWRDAPDLEGDHKNWGQWNEYIVKHVVPNIYAKTLEGLASNGCHEWILWPKMDAVLEGFSELVGRFVEEIKGLKVLPRSFVGELVPPCDAVWIETPTPALQALRPELLELCAKAGVPVVDPPEHVVQLLRKHDALQVWPIMRVLRDVLIPEAPTMDQPRLMRSLLAILEWVGKELKENDVLAIGNELEHVAWVPTQGGEVRGIRATFDPSSQLPALEVVDTGKANLDTAIKKQKLDKESVLRSLRLCGLKAEITWEDAVEEAKLIADAADVKRSELLLAHIEARHAQMRGSKADGVAQLMGIEWVMALGPCDPSLGPEGMPQLRALSELFAPCELQVVWAVAASLHCSAVQNPAILRPSRTVDVEPEILANQIHVLCTKGVSQSPGEPAQASAKTVEHLLRAFSRLNQLPLEASRKSQLLTETLAEVAFIPCLAKTVGAAYLFTPRCSALRSHQGHDRLSPALGVVRQDETVHAIALAAGVSTEPRADVLVEALDCAQGELAVNLAIELANRVRDGEELPGRPVLVPTSCGAVKPTTEVFIDDAPWQRSNVKTLHPQIGPEDGRFLGCTSLRDQLARQCEGDLGDGIDPFGQEADLVDQVKQLLQEYGGNADVVAEFIQNTDDFGADKLSFLLCSETFGKDRIVDERAKHLQGAALYICSSKPLTDSAIQQMQRVGRSQKRLDFSSAGRFGVGLNVMYRYCDCPQLLANDHLHFFDLTRKFVAREGTSRGRRFNTDRLRQDFPDSWAPFEHSDLANQYPVVFRLALRSNRSELGYVKSADVVLGELADIATRADKMLLFTRNLRRLSFRSGQHLLAAHTASIEDQASYDSFHDQLPSSLEELKSATTDLSMLSTRTITTKYPVAAPRSTAWAVAQHVSVGAEILALVTDIFEQPHGTALLPHGAAAVKLRPQDGDMQDGKVCCCLPTPQNSGSSAWVHGCFSLLSSRKSLPLPERNQAATLDQRWNELLLRGPVAQSLRGLLLHFRQFVGTGGELPLYFSIFPRRGDQLQKILAEATFSACLESEVFPVVAGDNAPVRWIAGPSPLLRTRSLLSPVQDALSRDGLDLANIPMELVEDYTAALGREQKVLDCAALCDFLRTKWHERHGQNSHSKELSLADAGMACLASNEMVLALLKFAVEQDWQSHKGGSVPSPYTYDYLQGTPLLLTHGSTLCAFGKEKFSQGWEILPRNGDLFVHHHVLQALRDGVDRTAGSVTERLELKPPALRPIRLNDLGGFKASVEGQIQKQLDFADRKNTVWQHLWSLIGRDESDWFNALHDWCVLPVFTGVPWSYGAVNMQWASNCVCIDSLQVDQTVRDGLWDALLACSISILNQGVLHTDKITEKLLPHVATTDASVLQLLLAKHEAGGVISNLSFTHRHAILGYFAVRCLSNSGGLRKVGELPLFMTAADGREFISLQPGKTYCCINPADKHATALAQLAPPGVVLLAWPTAQVRPIFDHVGIDVISGEDFMVKHVVPCLPDICRGSPDGVAAAKYLDELYAYVVQEESHVVRQASLKCRFVVAADSATMGCPADFVDPRRPIVKQFEETLKGSVPVSWMRTPGRFLKLLRALELSEPLTPALLLRCAEELDAMASADVGERLSAMSFELVEELSFLCIGALTGGLHPHSDLIKAASLRVLRVRQHEDADSIALETRRKDLSSTAHDTTKFKLCPFRGTAFGEAVPLVWAVCPTERHSHPQQRSAVQLTHLMEYCRAFMQESLGAYVGKEILPGELVMKQICNICACLPRHGDFVQVNSGKQLHQDLLGSWEHVGKYIYEQGHADQIRALVPPALPCVPVETKDEGSTPLRVVRLAPAGMCFADVDDVERCLRIYMRQVLQTTPHAPALFTALGVSKKPEAEDYARVTKQVAEEAAEAGASTKPHASAIAACLRGIAATDPSGLGTHELVGSRAAPLEVYIFDAGHKLELASSLIWCDDLSWQERCNGSPSLTFCEPLGHDHRKALALVRRAGLRALSKVVSERHIAGECPSSQACPLKDTLADFIQSEDFGAGIDAICHRGAASLSEYLPVGAPPFHPPSPAEVRDALRSVRLKSSANLRSALFLRAPPDSGDAGSESMIAGSERDQLAFFDALTKELLIPAELETAQIEALCTELASAMATALPKLVRFLDARVLEDVLHCAFGNRDIRSTLKKHQICFEHSAHTIGKGDQVPERLLDRLVDSMSETFGEGDLVAVSTDGSFFLGEILPWNSGNHANPVGLLDRMYRVDLGRKTIEVKHFDVYKICWKKEHVVPRQPMEVVLSSHAGAADRGDAARNAQGDAAAIEEVKRMLREMRDMPSDDYKAALRRLYRQWHPDKAGNTPLATMMFRMIHRHAEWYQDRLAGKDVGTDDWLNEYGVEADPAPAEGPRAEESAAPAAYQPTPGRQASWFEEFEKEMRTEHEARNNCTEGFVHIKQTQTFRPSGPRRIIDPEEADSWLQQAEIELLAACKLAEESPAGRALPASAVWHCEQAIEMALKSAMLRTCGLTETEKYGKGDNSLRELAQSLRSASAMTEQQRRAQQLPMSDDDMAWLKQAYLAARYPNASRCDVPAYQYGMADAERAIGLARACLHWAKWVEDLPEPGSTPASAQPMARTVPVQVCAEPPIPPGPTAPKPAAPAEPPTPAIAEPAVVAPLASGGAPPLPSAPPPPLAFLPPERRPAALAAAE